VCHPSISKDLVFQTAERLQKEGDKVTVIKVYKSIGSGSMSTVNKYLKAWKELHSDGERLDPIQLKQQLAEQLKINEKLTAEFLNSSTLAATQSAEIAKLEAKILELEAKIAEQERVRQEMVAELNWANQSNKEAFDRTVDVLAAQIAAINEQAIRKVQEVGQHFDERVIENKLAMRALSEQLALKDKELKKLRLELNGLPNFKKFGS
jgi:hypothetical protein